MRDPNILRFELRLAPGDTLAATAAINDLHLAYPDKYITGFSGTAEYLFENNPHIAKFKSDSKNIWKCRVIELQHPLIKSSNKVPYHFIHAFRKRIEKELNVKIPARTITPKIYMSPKEMIKPPIIKGQQYWVLMAGGKYDFTNKWWNPDFYQEVVDHFKGKITFIQTGLEKHFHPKLDGVIDLIGKSNKRDFVNLIYHSVGVVTPISFGMHLAAGVPLPEYRKPFKNRACVVIAGGREPVHWTQYTYHKFLHSIGTMDCCANGGCWTSRCHKMGDKRDDKRVCNYPVRVVVDNENCPYNPLYIPKCMVDITPTDVIRAIESWYIGGALRYNG